ERGAVEIGVGRGRVLLQEAVPEESFDEVDVGGGVILHAQHEELAVGFVGAVHGGVGAVGAAPRVAVPGRAGALLTAVAGDELGRAFAAGGDGVGVVVGAERAGHAVEELGDPADGGGRGLGI